MPILQGALLCDAAHDYGGLVSILGGFVSVTLVPSLPTPAPVWFAGRVGFRSDELDRPHTLIVSAESEAGLVLGEVRAELPPVTLSADMPAPELAPGVNLVFPFPFPIVAEGLYWVILRVDGDELEVRLPLKVILRGGAPPLP